MNKKYILLVILSVLIFAIFGVVIANSASANHQQCIPMGVDWYWDWESESCQQQICPPGSSGYDNIPDCAPDEYDPYDPCYPVITNDCGDLDWSVYHVGQVLDPEHPCYPEISPGCEDYAEQQPVFNEDNLPDCPLLSSTEEPPETGCYGGPWNHVPDGWSVEEYCEYIGIEQCFIDENDIPDEVEETPVLIDTAVVEAEVEDVVYSEPTSGPIQGVPTSTG